MTLGDRIVVMADGIIQQQGTPFDVYRHPANRFVASFIGTPPMNFVDGAIVGDAGGLRFEAGDGSVTLAVDASHGADVAGAAGLPVTLGLRPQAMSLVRADQPGRTVRATARVIELLGDQMDITCDAGGHTIVARVRAEPGLSPGDSVLLAVEPDRVHYFRAGEFGESLLSADLAGARA